MLPEALAMNGAVVSSTIARERVPAAAFPAVSTAATSVTSRVPPAAIAPGKTRRTARGSTSVADVGIVPPLYW